MSRSDAVRRASNLADSASIQPAKSPGVIAESEPSSPKTSVNLKWGSTRARASRNSP